MSCQEKKYIAHFMGGISHIYSTTWNVQVLFDKPVFHWKWTWNYLCNITRILDVLTREWPEPNVHLILLSSVEDVTRISVNLCTTCHIL